MVASPGSKRFYPPVRVLAFRQTLKQSIRRNHLRLPFGFLVPALLFLGLAVIESPDPAIYWAASFAFLSGVLLIDYRYALRHTAGIFERALFFQWFYGSRRTRVGFLLWASAGLLAVGLQLALTDALGSETAVFHAYGAMYDRIGEGELWRLFTGPFLHYSPVHFINNFVLLMLIGPLSWSLFRAASLAVFILGNSSGVFVQFALGGQAFDNCGGISFGLYALFGYLIGAGILNKRLLPRGLTTLLCGVALLGIVSSEILSPTAATAGHVGGLLAGVGCRMAARWLYGAASRPYAASVSRGAKADSRQAAGR